MDTTKSTFEEANNVFMRACKWQSTESNNTITTTDILAFTTILLYHELHLWAIGVKHWKIHSNKSKTGKKMIHTSTAMHNITTVLHIMSRTTTCFPRQFIKNFIEIYKL